MQASLDAVVARWLGLVSAMPAVPDSTVARMIPACWECGHDMELEWVCEHCGNRKAAPEPSAPAPCPVRLGAKERPGVHRAHCCTRHGCKYGYDDCPIVDGSMKQDDPCEDCESEPPASCCPACHAVREAAEAMRDSIAGANGEASFDARCLDALLDALAQPCAGRAGAPAVTEREPLPVEPSEAAIEAARRAMVKADCAETKAWLVQKWRVTPEETQAMIGEALQDVDGYGPLVEIAVRAAYSVDFARTTTL